MKKKIRGVLVCTLLILGSTPLFISYTRATNSGSGSIIFNTVWHKQLNHDFPLSYRVGVGDVDGDGIDDVTVLEGHSGAGMAGDYPLYVLKGSNGNELWPPTTVYTDGTTFVRLADIDGDNKCEVIVHADQQWGSPRKVSTIAYDDNGDIGGIFRIKPYI